VNNIYASTVRAQRRGTASVQSSRRSLFVSSFVCLFIYGWSVDT